MVQVGRRRREAGRQPVRDRDRQGVDGGAVDHGRHADGNPRAGGRGRAGRRRGRGDRGRGRGGRERASAACACSCRQSAATSRSFPRKREPRAKDWVPAFAGTNGKQTRQLMPTRTSIRSSRCARRRATSARRSCRAAPSSRRWRGGSPARTASISAGCRGSGPHGRIVAADVEIGDRQEAGRPRRADGRPARSAAQVKALYQGVEFEEVPLDGMRATIARRLVEAKQTIPHFYLTADVTMDALLKLREEANAGAPKTRTARRPTSSRSTISSSRRWRWRCSGCRRPTRCGPATASCASRIPMSASRSRSTAAC